MGKSGSKHKVTVPWVPLNMSRTKLEHLGTEGKKFLFTVESDYRHTGESGISVYQ